MRLPLPLLVFINVEFWQLLLLFISFGTYLFDFISFYLDELVDICYNSS